MSDKLKNKMFEVLSYSDMTEEQCGINIVTGVLPHEKYIEFSVENYSTTNDLRDERNLFKEVYEDFKPLFGEYFFNGTLTIQNETFNRVENIKTYKELLTTLNETQKDLFKELVINIARFKLKTINEILREKYTLSNFNLSQDEKDLLAMNSIIQYHGVPA